MAFPLLLSRYKNIGGFAGSEIATAWALSFNGTTSRANCGSNLDDLHDNAFTFEALVKFTGSTFNRMIIDKGLLLGVGWGVYINVNGAARFEVNCAVASTGVATPNNSLTDGAWHHVAAHFDDAGDRKARVALDGTWYTASSAGNGAIASDAAGVLALGCERGLASWIWHGLIGWIRISDNNRYNAPTAFTPPSRITIPSTDANTLELWQVNQGAGNATASVTTPGNDGVLTAVTWVNI